MPDLSEYRWRSLTQAQHTKMCELVDDGWAMPLPMSAQRCHQGCVDLARHLGDGGRYYIDRRGRVRAGHTLRGSRPLLEQSA